MASDQGGALEAQLGAWGLVVVSDLALAAGVASIPGPVTDASDDGWFVWEPLLNRMQSASLLEPRIFEFDSKAMRRVEEGSGIAVVVENASAATGLIFTCGISLLTSLS